MIPGCRLLPCLDSVVSTIRCCVARSGGRCCTLCAGRWAACGRDDGCAAVWLGALLLLTLVRAITLCRYGRTAVVGRMPEKARIVLLAGLAASGVLWGAAAIWLMPDHDFAGQAIMCFFAAGMTAGAAASVNAVRLAFELFSAPLLLMLTAELALQDESAAYFMSVAVLVFAVIMFGVARSGRRQLEEARTLWLANRRLRIGLLRARYRAATARRRANALSAEMEQAEAQMANRSMVLATVSHELRTPLNAVIGFSDMIADEFYGSVGDPRYRSYAQDIRQSALHLRSLIEDLLTMSRWQVGRADLELETVPVKNACSEAMREFAMSHSQEASRLVRDVEPDDLAIHVDRRLVYQIVRNLIENALKFSDPGTPIRVEGRPEGADLARIRVVNHGPTIPQDKIDSILEPFVQGGGNAPRSGGVGLGLALVKQFAELLGGRIEVENREGEGVAVSVILPRP